MAASIHVLGIRHHGPGSARLVRDALARIEPGCVLIEGPADADEAIALAAHEAMRPPVALLVYEPDSPRHAAYYPFAEFSPEWQAMRWGLEHGAVVRFIDLPYANRGADAEHGQSEMEGEGAEEESETRRAIDPLEALALAAGYSDGEQWWSLLIEERRGEGDPLSAFDGIRDAMLAAREHLGAERRDRDEPLREAHMRRAIRAAVKGGHERIAVVCGAWHAPVLSAEALEATTAKADNDLLKGLPKRKTAATWIPWTYGRLALDSGYGAGVASPGWYEHLWQNDEHVAERWMTRTARLMRDEDLDASPASVIESVRLAEALAAMRGRSIPGLDELGEATLAILCHGNVLPMRVIERKLVVSERLGEVPEEAPVVPLQRDLTALQKSLRMKVSAEEKVLDLDQRNDTDLARSRLLHRLCLLGIGWGELFADQRQRTSTFHEVWQIQWRPELSVAVIEASRFGNTVEEAAGACVAERAAKARDLPALTELLGHTLLADLSGAVSILVSRLQAVSAVATDLAHLLDALPPLARVMRYGNVRGTDAAQLEPIVSGIVGRVVAGLGPACTALDDEAADAMRARLEAAHAALTTLAREDLLGPFRERLRTVGDADVHGLVAGRCWRMLLDVQDASPEEAEQRLSLALSHGNDPGKASAWLEGFLAGSGLVLVHDERLLAIIDAWVAALPGQMFEEVCPIVRRTLSTFEAPERRAIGERVKRLRGEAAPVAATEAGGDYDAERAALVEPVLRMILGELP